jgi:gliding motility-associated-like protein
VELCIYDQNGNPIPCGCFRYTGGPNIPGFYPVGGAGCAYGGIDQYKPWTLVGVNLSNYIGQTLNVVITNVDCAQCGHWAYSYWDFMCGTAGLSAGCVGNQSTICGPIDANIAYTYQWYHNGVPISSPQGTQQCITITAQPNDTFLVEVKQPSGCNFKIVYVPPFIQPGFTFTGACGTYTFTNTSTVSPANVSITGYTWSFPGGTPSSSTSPSPVVNYANPGTYTVALTVSISAGCTATATQTINVAPPPKAQIVPSPACQGDLVTLTDASISSAGDPIVSWNWSMPAGTPATGTGTLVTTTYNTAGNHVATLTVTTAQGCSSSTSVPVQVYAPPLANFSGGDSGCVPICVNYTDLSTSSDGNIVSWEWSFPGGVPSSSTSQNPGQVCYNTLGTYSTTLVVTTQYGCKNTITMPTVSTYPWPSADFCIAPNGPVSAADPTFKFCDLWSSDVTQWTWYFGDNDSDKVNTDPIHSYSASVTANDFYSFNVCLRVLNQYGCWDTICKRVEIIPESTFYIPNTFTPNEDLVNDVFFGKGRGIKDYSIWIFDRWGNLIWDCHHSDKNTNWDNPGQDGLPSYCKWDGKVEGGGADLNGRSNQVVQEDVYVWKVKLTDVFDKKHTYIGHVNVVR